jgi:hypothetical protein
MSASSPRAYRPDLLFAAGGVRPGAALTVGGGAVLAVGLPVPGAELVSLPSAALLPGLVSAHGHAFQRALRGRAQRAAPGRSSFWTWREAMYAAALGLAPDDLEAVARLLFLEAARSGVTAWGEFHYLHRDPAGAPYRDPDELARRVVRAGREVGLRLTLLRSSYGRAGFGRAPEPAQRRFADPSPDDAVTALDRLAASHRADPLVRFGLAPHSVRACPAEWIRGLAAEAARRGCPLHLHAAEQPREVDECRAEHGCTPVQLLESLGALGPSTTAVHAIHLGEGDAERLGAARAIDYRREDFAARIRELTERRGVDVILDHIGAKYLKQNLDSLTVGGRLVEIGLMGGAQAEVNLGALLTRRLSIIGSTLRGRSVGEKAAIVRGFRDRFGHSLAAGRLRPVVDRVLPLAEAAEAHRLMKSSEHFGKIVLRVG